MFYFDKFNGKKILKSDMLKDYDCFFTTREFVLTKGALDELKTECETNRKILETELKGTIKTPVQVHSANIQNTVPEKNIYENTDALISNTEGDIILLNFADCVPIILYDKSTNTGSVVHAGWRGTAANIAALTVEKMNKDYGVLPENITALIGPAIGKCCFETDKDVFEQLIKDKSDFSLYEKKGEKYYPDLKLINYNSLKNAGVKNIDICDYCTSCMSGIFFSYRKEKGITARHSAVLQIKRG